MKNKLVVILFTLLFFSNGCAIPDANKMMSEANKFRELVQQSCTCDEVSILNYQITNQEKTDATCKLVGCEFDSIDQETDKIIKVLKDSLPIMCEFRNLNFLFVNRSKTVTKKYYRCQEVSF